MLAMAKKELIPEIYSRLGWNRVLLCPPVDNAMNIIDFCLYTRFYNVRRDQNSLSECGLSTLPSLQAWFKQFFSVSGISDIDRSTHISEPPVYSILSRCSSTFHMTWTYDEEINFKPAAPR